MLTPVRASDKVPAQLRGSPAFLQLEVSPAPSPVHLAAMQHHEIPGF